MIKGVNKALVIGGGIGGMACAIALRKRGVAVDLIDIDPEWKVYGAGLTITGPTLRAFRDLGLLDAIREEGFLTVGAHLHLFDGTLLSTRASVPIEPGLPAAGGIMRPKLHQIMSSELRRGGVDVRLGLSADSFDQSADGVTVTFSDGSSQTYDLAVGADGIYSPTRAMLFENPVEPTYTGQMIFRVVAPRPPEMDVHHIFFGHRNIAGINPCGKDKVYAFILHAEPIPTKIPPEQQEEYLRELLTDFGGSIATIRDNLGPESSIVHRPFESAFQPRPWHQGRVVLIGDAVHSTTPHLASGAGMAVEDALVLAEELAAADGDVEKALIAYTDRRFERCKYVVETSLAIGKLQLERAPPPVIGALMDEAMQRLATPI